MKFDNNLHVLFVFVFWITNFWICRIICVLYNDLHWSIFEFSDFRRHFWSTVCDFFASHLKSLYSLFKFLLRSSTLWPLVCVCVCVKYEPIRFPFIVTESFQEDLILCSSLQFPIGNVLNLLLFWYCYFAARFFWRSWISMRSSQHPKRPIVRYLSQKNQCFSNRWIANEST